MKKTLIIGASSNPNRYSYKAAQMLLQNEYEIIPFGIKKGEVFDHKIVNNFEDIVNEKIDTVTLYVSPKNQKELIQPIIALQPKRIIFNPGTENSEFQLLAEQNNIQTEEACTLVMLSTNLY